MNRKPGAHAAYMRKYREKRREKLADAPHGTDDGYRNWGCRCSECRAAGTQSISKNFKVMAARSNARNRRQAAVAANHYKQWTSAELELITARNEKGYLHTQGELATLLGRSFSAVEAMRRKCREDPTYDRLVGRSTRTP